MLPCSSPPLPALSHQLWRTILLMPFKLIFLLPLWRTIVLMPFKLISLWRTIVLMPFKLISVYLHEIGHASACVMTGGKVRDVGREGYASTCVVTGGKVEGIEVHMDEGGVTRTRGGWQWCILPAGYLGSSFWGMVLVLCATNKWTTLCLSHACVCIACGAFTSLHPPQPDLGSSFWGMVLVLCANQCTLSHSIPYARTPMPASTHTNQSDLGSSFWGMVLVLCATNKWTTLVIAVILCITLFITLFLAKNVSSETCVVSTTLAIAVILCITLFITLFLAKNNTLRFLCVGFLLLFGLFFFLEYGITQSVHPLNLAILFIGIMNCLFSIYDIYDDLISRRVNSSDAEVFAKTCPCPFNGVCWGVIWGVISLFLAAAAVYLGLVILA
ncbi:unnamed protein product [Closterium sp. NIES-65]|nr:unnamed protein product [Closterium sp. NIES-65]